MREFLPLYPALRRYASDNLLGRSIVRRVPEIPQVRVLYYCAMFHKPAQQQCDMPFYRYANARQQR